MHLSKVTKYVVCQERAVERKLYIEVSERKLGLIM